MSLTGVIASFATGTYTVTRPGVGTFTDGRFVPGAPTTLFVEAVVVPVSGRDLDVVPAGKRADDVRTLYTRTALSTVASLRGSDVITIGGEPFEVYAVEYWDAFGESFCAAKASRLEVP